MRSAFFGLLGLLALAACAAPESSTSGGEQDIIGPRPAPAPSVADVKVEDGALIWGQSANFGGDAAHVAGVHAFLFQGEPGDAVVAKASLDSAGTVHILRKTSTGFTSLAKSAITTPQGEVKANLPAAGTYAIAYEAKVGSDASMRYNARLTLSGAPVSPDAALGIAVRDTWDESLDYPGTASEFKTLAPTKLPKEARALLDKWNADFAPEGATAGTWTLGGSDAIVIQSWHDNGLSLAFFTQKGAKLAEGSALEDHDFYWTDDITSYSAAPSSSDDVPF